jgi:membrane protease YdiL (CAAX protease family)
MNIESSKLRHSANLLKRHPWVIFLLQQAILFASGWVYLNVVRMLTGKTIHNGRDPFGLIDGIAFVLFVVAMIILTKWLYHRVKGNQAPSLGIALSSRRFRDFLVGTLIGFVIQASAWVVSLMLGTVRVGDKVGAHFNKLAIVSTLSVGIFFLLLNSILEETTSRAFPMRLWAHRSLIFRILIPSIFFATLHLADEQFGGLLFYERFIGGVVLSVAYALTGNIWLACGLHTGINYARFSVSGLWHAGAVVTLVGQLYIPLWAADIIWSLIAIAGYLWLRSHERGLIYASADGAI